MNRSCKTFIASVTKFGIRFFCRIIFKKLLTTLSITVAVANIFCVINCLNILFSETSLAVFQFYFFTNFEWAFLVQFPIDQVICSTFQASRGRHFLLITSAYVNWQWDVQTAQKTILEWYHKSFNQGLNFCQWPYHSAIRRQN